jgi:hypothetical protein
MADKIALVVVPWGVLTGFYAATFLCLRKAFPLALVLVTSLVCSFVFSFLLWFVTGLLFDPMF